MSNLGPTAFLFLVVLGLIIAIAWIVLPFALIGTKPILREIRRELQRNNELLSAIAEGRALQANHAHAASGPDQQTAYQHVETPRRFTSALPPT